MKITKHLNKTTKIAALTFSFTLLSACGSSSDSPATSDSATPIGNSTICTPTDNDINWEALLAANCENLSDYNLFTDATDPTGSVNENGIPYDLSTPLFTDYASKYRYLFVPGGETAAYSENEVMDFPLGTVLVKTFSLPANTANREGAETIIETRLLINRSNGWKALPYYWETTNDAQLAISGKTIEDVSLIHNGETKTFDYAMPSAGQCTKCHSVLPLAESGETQGIFKPIGPKARFLNNDYTYENGTENQLTHWVNAGILTGVPSDLNTIDTAATFTDSDTPSAMSDEELELASRSYLDINCAHCHRSKLTIPEGLYNGIAGSSGLHLEYNREFNEASQLTFGVCKSALAGGDTNYPYNIIPSYPEKSYLAYRMNTNIERHRMPASGRSTIHAEGVALIKEWIKRMPANNCGVEGL